MNDGDIPNFKNEKEEIKYWKDTALQLYDKVDELEKELVEFQENSSQLEKELEKSLEHADRTNRDLKTKCNRLTLELDLCREKYEQHCHQSSKQISELEKEISEFVEKEEKLLKYIRDLEQKNDDLERAERVMLESAGDMEAKLNSAIERNALLENELDEKETLKTMLQRLKDEQRDMQQELNRQRRQIMPDNNKVSERVRTPVDVNKLSLETQTAGAPMKSKKDHILKRSVSADHSIACLSNVAGNLNPSEFQYTNINSRIRRNIDKKKEFNNKKKENVSPEKTKYYNNNFARKNNFINDINNEFKSAFSFIRLKSKKRNNHDKNFQKIKNNLNKN